MSSKMRTLKKWSAVVGWVAMVGVWLLVMVPAAGESSPESESVTGGKAGPAAPAQQGQPKLTLWRIIELGGPLMYVLFALSIAMVAMITYFFLAFNPRNIMPPDFLKRLRQSLREKKMDQAKMLCAQNRNIVSHIIRSGLEASQKGAAGVLESMNSEGGRRASSLWQKITFLSDIAAIAPMVGLLGTVIGMFQAFMSVSSSGITAGGQINPMHLTSGVAMAVITTIAGLIIGILATMAYAYFRGVVQKIIVNLEAVCSRYADIVAEGTK